MSPRTAIRVSTLTSQPSNHRSDCNDLTTNGLSSASNTCTLNEPAHSDFRSFNRTSVKSLISDLIHSGLHSLTPGACKETHAAKNLRAPGHSGFGLRAPVPPTSLAPSANENSTSENLLADAVSTVEVPAPEPKTADEILATLQERSVKSAQSELAAGVREIGSTNRSPRVDAYTRAARMSLGGEWCGYFVNWNYHVVAEELGGRFSLSMHSLQKGRDSYLYRSYTSVSHSTKARLDALAETHREQGSMRQLFAFENSPGHKRAQRLGKPAQLTNDYQKLPIRPGDTALFEWGHLGLVESYDANTGRLTTIEGNAGNRVRHKVYDLSQASVRAKFVGFGRPALGDFHLSENQIESLASD